MFTNSWNRWQNGRTVIVWLWDIFVPKFKWSRHHPVSFFAVKCRKNGYFYSFSGCRCSKSAAIVVKGWNSNGLALRHAHATNQVKLSSLSVIFCRKNGHFHSFSGCWYEKPAVKGGKQSNSIGLTLRHDHAKNQVKLSSFSVIFCCKMP